ncbi:hypothetical protein LTR84_005439 [Exophiala bonariae]|uniref:Chlorophyll synthesis pathway protein BchC n=1 Tax=Exophiala bonariae TaxID=1690606 RepID=A0AAV9N818_9EURO|nr:hypothetical protein LTR84_005439 [Exophiala bonariae]
MRAALFYGKEDIQVKDVPDPTDSCDKILVDIEWCGLCGSDLHLFQHGPEVFGDLTKHGEELPYALGHEFCGRVNSAPPGSGFKHGDPVMIDPRLPCGQCIECKSGKDYGCPKQGGIGYNHSGGLAEKVTVPARNLHRLPETVPLEFAALIEPFAVVMHAIRKLNISDWTEQDVLVLGGGPIGFALVIALRSYKPRKIIVSEPTAVRREKIAQFVDLVVDPLERNVPAACRQLCAGGVDVVFDCAGSAPGLVDGLDALKCEGKYMNIAMHEKPMTLSALPLALKHVTIIFSAVYNATDMDETIKLFAQGTFHGYEGMVTKRMLVDDVVKEGFKELIEHKDDHIKILITPKAHLIEG